MRTSELKELIREIVLNELDMDKTVQRKIDEFGQLSDEMDKLKHQIEGVKKRYSQIEDELRPILEELHRFGQKSLQTQRFLVSIKRMGYDRENLRYKETFEQSLEKVNKQTRKVLEELLQSTKTISRVVSSVGVQPVSEGFFSDLIKKVKSLFGRLVPQLKRTNKDMDELQRVSKLISK
jgi:septation ring formation regulator EzrA